MIKLRGKIIMGKCNVGKIDSEINYIIVIE